MKMMMLRSLFQNLVIIFTVIVFFFVYSRRESEYTRLFPRQHKQFPFVCKSDRVNKSSTFYLQPPALFAQASFVLRTAALSARDTVLRVAAVARSGSAVRSGHLGAETWQRRGRSAVRCRLPSTDQLFIVCGRSQRVERPLHYYSLNSFRFFFNSILETLSLFFVVRDSLRRI